MTRRNQYPNKIIGGGMIALLVAAFASSSSSFPCASATATATSSSWRASAFAIPRRRPPTYRSGHPSSPSTLSSYPASAMTTSARAGWRRTATTTTTMLVGGRGVRFAGSRSYSRRRLHGASSSSALSLFSPTSSSMGVVVSRLLGDLFASRGSVPLSYSLSFNAALFCALRPKLLTMLTPSGYIHAFALGTMLWTALGWRGWTVCVMYLFLGQAVTKVGFEEKEALGIAEGRGGRRGPENVWGSALTGAMCAAAAARALLAGGSGGVVPCASTSFGLSTDLWLLGYVASLSTKLADTFASEIGKAYGKTTFLITTLKPVPRGTEGAVSIEGTVASVIGGLLLSVYAYGVAGLLRSPGGVAISTLAAFVATMVESLIGATLQGREGSRWLTNEVVNFFNTLIGAFLAMSLGVLFLGI
ncbi:hypothetical protein ACHAXA_003789 [Cyclostephanos tholiformis]|uniref:DUF92 domain-containing protein n=1 Tax=Cyclostephanos tholiformis TaxID=382380 RepID=A0ABD3RMC7_9STRA